ncbi:MAG: amino acid deaminase [Planctomycetales bacterium]|nr:amino acid deaminase [Planctomycetales bacterium]
MLSLDGIESLLIDDRYKGIPGGTTAFPLKEMGRQGWNLLRGDVPLPLAVLKESTLAHNRSWMQRFLAISGAQFAPHGKTTMAPQLFQMQLEDGAWGITLATMQQVQVARRFGCSRILLANELIDPRAIDYIVAELARNKDLEFLCLVDSVVGVEALAGAVKKHGLKRPLEVLLEGGLAGGRTGCRTMQNAMEVARAVRNNSPYLALRGVEGFEGIIAEATPQASAAKVKEFLGFLLEIACCCDEEGLFAGGKVVISAGGSEYFDLVADILPKSGLTRDTQIIIRSGCYLTHDSDLFVELHRKLEERTPTVKGLGDPPRGALEIWTHVLSRPEPTRAILGIGKRDASHDARLPLPVLWFRPGVHQVPQPMSPGHTTFKLHDQHALLNIPEDSPIQIGDLVACGISHPCTTFDKWRLLALVDDQYNITGGVHTFF